MLGKHVIYDLKFAGPDHLTNSFRLPMVNACMLQGARVIDSAEHHFGKDFGYTFTILLAESHVSCHTWPEVNKACIDIFTCGTVEPEKIFATFEAWFQEGDITVMKKTVLERGNSDV